MYAGSNFNIFKLADDTLLSAASENNAPAVV
jgi:hypothetical protein